MKKPKAPAPTQEETLLRQRQVEELARLDDEENRRVKGLTRGRMGPGSLFGKRRSGGSQGATAAAGADGGGSGGGGNGWSGYYS